jgi:hypothetical protein
MSKLSKLSTYTGWAGIAVLVLALVGQFMAYRSANPVAVHHASWDFKPQSFEEVVNKAKNIVAVEVVSVAAGPDLVVPAKDLPNNEDRIPTQHITARVVVKDKGEVQEGQEITIFRTGGTLGEVSLPAGPPRSGPPDEKRGHVRQGPQPGGKPAADPNLQAPQPDQATKDPDTPANAADARVFLLFDDPPYQVGERYYMALTDGPNNTQRPVSPEGRYKIGENNRLQAVTDTPAAQGVAGRELAEVRSAARGQTRIPPGRVQRRVTTEEPPTVGMPRTGEHSHGGGFGNEIALFYIGTALAALGVGLGVASRIASRRRG